MAEIKNLQKLGAVVKVNEMPGQFLSKILLIQKPNGSYNFKLYFKN